MEDLRTLSWLLVEYEVEALWCVCVGRIATDAFVITSLPAGLNSGTSVTGLVPTNSTVNAPHIH